MQSHSKVEVRATITDGSGKIVKRYPWTRANSLIKQFIQDMMAHMSQVAQTVLDITNVARTCAVSGSGIDCAAAAALTTKGIVIGTGTNAVAMTDYALQTQVTANIDHGSMSIGLENPDANTWRVALQRAFVNNTGGTLSIKEVGLYALISGLTFSMCIDRTLYSVDVASGLTLTLTYRITISL